MTPAFAAVATTSLRAAALRRSTSNGSAGPSSADGAYEDLGESRLCRPSRRRDGAAGDEPVKGEKLAEAQDIPLQFLEHILLELKHARLVRARRGARGGYWLAQPPEEITLGERDPRRRGAAGEHPGPGAGADQVPGNAEQLSEVWIAVRASLRRVLENVTIADLRDGKIPAEVLELTRDEGAGITR